jgi:PHP family Zn ribbon phosphoesterase
MVKIIGNFEVNDWVHWKKMFDQHSNAREAARIKTIYVGNEIENTNKVHIVMETPAADTMQKFMQDPENAKVIEQSGHKQETTVMSICSD